MNRCRLHSHIVKMHIVPACITPLKMRVWLIVLSYVALQSAYAELMIDMELLIIM